MAGLLAFFGWDKYENIQKEIDLNFTRTSEMDSILASYNKEILRMDSILKTVSPEKFNEQVVVVEGLLNKLDNDFKNLDNDAARITNRIQSINATLNDFTRIYLSKPVVIDPNIIPGEVFFKWDDMLGKNHPNREEIIEHHTTLLYSPNGGRLDYQVLTVNNKGISIKYEGTGHDGNLSPMFYLLVFSK